jgi:DNA-3-methyladenine glycosylase I
MSAYCAVAASDPLHRPYHDRDYGFPQRDETRLFEQLILEMNQAGLSWALMLKKRGNFRAAYAGFDVDAVAAFTEADVERLAQDAGIIRNRLKIRAAIHNARRIQAMRAEGGFAAWLDSHHPNPLSAWTKILSRRLKFMGGELSHEFLMCLGYLPGAHHPGCPVYAEIAKLDAPWRRDAALVRAFEAGTYRPG